VSALHLHLHGISIASASCAFAHTRKPRSSAVNTILNHILMSTHIQINHILMSTHIQIFLLNEPILLPSNTPLLQLSFDVVRLLCRRACSSSSSSSRSRSASSSFTECISFG
jgi:hypothetical protein